MTVEIAKGIYSVGVRDWNITDFHGYSLDKGTSYNAFLIVDEKIVLVDTVKHDFAEQLLSNISKIVDPKKIDFVVSNHAEMDHSGAIVEVMNTIGIEKPIYCSKAGVRAISEHFHNANLNLIAVAKNQEMNIGTKTLSFIPTAMLHWPDSMFTYVKEDGVLFSSDAFGQHYASYDYFDDDLEENSSDNIMQYAKKYFANILLPQSKKVIKLLSSVAEMNLDLKILCPDHGIIWRKNPSKIINAYLEWAEQKGREKVVIIYDTMWKSTQKLAEKIYDGIHEEGVRVKPICLKNTHRSDVMTEVLDAKAVIVGSPTLNDGMYPTVADFLSYMKGLKPQNKLAGVFSSSGWSGKALKLIHKELYDMDFTIIEECVDIKNVPDENAKVCSVNFGKIIAERVKE